MTSNKVEVVAGVTPSVTVLVNPIESQVVTVEAGRAGATGATGADASTIRAFSIAVFDSDVNCAAGDGKLGFCVPATMAGMDVTDIVCTSYTAGTTGTMDVQLRRRRVATDVDVLSTVVTVDSTEPSSITAATGHTIDTANDDLLEGDLLFIDVDAVQTTPAKGLTVTVTADLP